MKPQHSPRSESGEPQIANMSSLLSTLVLGGDRGGRSQEGCTQASSLLDSVRGQARPESQQVWLTQEQRRRWAS